jgi:hypothetical protein
VPYPSHDTRQDATPNKRKEKKRKKTKKKPSAQPPKKDALAVGGRIGQIVRLPLLLTKNKFIHPTIQIWSCW